MFLCSAPACNNSSTKGYLLKRFPRDPERRARWATSIQKTNWEPTNNSYICEVHFDDDQWESKRMDRLKWNAVPTIFQQRLKYIKRKDLSLPRTVLPITPVLSSSIDQNQSQLVYIIRVDDYLAGMTKAIDTTVATQIYPSGNVESGYEAMRDEICQFSSEIKQKCEKDAIIAELRKEIAEKDVSLLKYEKIICQMNSHLEKLKGRLKFWRDFKERDKFCLRKVRKIHKSLTA